MTKVQYLSRGSSSFLIPLLYASSAFYTFVVSPATPPTPIPLAPVRRPSQPKLAVRSLRRKADLSPDRLAGLERVVIVDEEADPKTRECV